MKKILLCVFLCVSAKFFRSCVGESEPKPPTLQKNGNKVYIVYMGAAAPSSNGAMRKDQAQLITSLLKRNSKALVYTYTNGFCGFSARLTAEEARSIAQSPGVVSVFPDPILQLQTTRSWDFLDSMSYKKISPSGHGKSLTNTTTTDKQSSSNEADTIIGFIDSGIWPESPSFNDNGMGPIPPRWKGQCVIGVNFTSSDCNRKIIGARYYSDVYGMPFLSVRDNLGHGSHVASTASGSIVENISYYGQATGTVRGGSPSSRISVYKVCNFLGCSGSSILKSFEDSISDGVDILSISLLMLKNSQCIYANFSNDPIAIGSFHATEKGIAVVCAAGNNGPDPSTVRNDAPWVLTVAASTTDRDIQSHILLGNKTLIKGGGIHSSSRDDPMPLATGASVKYASDELARDCLPWSLDPWKAWGKIIVCETRFTAAYSNRVWEVMRVGGNGVILIVNQNNRLHAYNFGIFPGSMITEEEGNQVFGYLNSTRDPWATIAPTVTVIGNKPAPAVAYFSGRGPSFASLNNLLKPDISAPGVDILAAWTYGSFNLNSGTSMACPHASGIFSTVKAQNPNFSISAIRSAIITTATQTNNLNAPIMTTEGAIATPYDIGAGELNPIAALDPGLVYETEIADYVQFLCATGYTASEVHLISSTVPEGFECPKLTEDAISGINYPSIAVSNLKQGEPRTVARTVSNVGPQESVYTAIIEPPSGIEVRVTPNKLVFTKQENRISYNLTFIASYSPTKDTFGSITWTSGKYRVRSPIVVSV